MRRFLQKDPAFAKGGAIASRLLKICFKSGKTQGTKKEYRPSEKTTSLSRATTARRKRSPAKLRQALQQQGDSSEEASKLPAAKKGPGLRQRWGSRVTSVKNLLQKRKDGDQENAAAAEAGGGREARISEEMEDDAEEYQSGNSEEEENEGKEEGKSGEARQSRREKKECVIDGAAASFREAAFNAEEEGAEAAAVRV